MSSIQNESLFNEAANQALIYPYHYVIIVGELKRYVTSSWSYARTRDYPQYVYNSYAKYHGALRRLRTFTTPIEVDTEEQAFTEMLVQAEKCLDSTQSFAGVVRKATIPKANPCWLFLTCIPGISAKKAKVIIEEYNIQTLEDLLQLDKDKLIRINGIGEKTAEKIVTFIYE